MQPEGFSNPGFTLYTQLKFPNSFPTLPHCTQAKSSHWLLYGGEEQERAPPFVPTVPSFVLCGHIKANSSAPIDFFFLERCAYYFYF